jgi:hypothetical protein
MKHNSNILQQAEATSLATICRFNRVEVHKFFDALKNIVDEYDITAARIFNMDETSHIALQCPEKFVVQKR